MGRLPCLSEAAFHRAHTLTRLRAASVSLCQYPGESLDVSLGRFLTARKGKVPLALEMVQEHLRWARELDLVGLRKMSPAQVLGVSPEAVAEARHP